MPWLLVWTWIYLPTFLPTYLRCGKILWYLFWYVQKVGCLVGWQWNIQYINYLKISSKYILLIKKEKLIG